MRTSSKLLFQVMSPFLALAFAPIVVAQKIETFDADPTQVQCRETSPTSINDRGDVTGSCFTFVFHGFVRSSDGHTVIFDPPFDPPNANCDTKPSSINDAGDIAGEFTCPGNVHHGFLRDSRGDFIVFDAPNSSSDSMEVAGINDAGEITGSFFDPVAGRARSFVRDEHGGFIVFDAPMPTSNLLYTESHGINRAGDIVGTFAPRDKKLNVSGFVRDHEGNITVFSAPNAAERGLQVLSINARGEIVGAFTDATSGTRRGYIRDRDRSFTIFNSPTGNLVDATSINDRGDVVGSFLTLVQSGFLRNPKGKFLPFSPAGAEIQFLAVLGINNRQEIVGAFLDASKNAVRGFIARF